MALPKHPPNETPSAHLWDELRKCGVLDDFTRSTIWRTFRQVAGLTGGSPPDSISTDALARALIELTKGADQSDPAFV
jgi:hypothetical protein